MNSKYVYWGSTILVAVFVLFSGVMYFVAQAPVETFERLGFPDYFRVQLGIAKLIGGLALLSPLPRWIKEWTYAGFTIDFGSALVAHIVVGDPVSAMVMPVIGLALLFTSYGAYRTYYLGSEGDANER